METIQTTEQTTEQPQNLLPNNEGKVGKKEENKSFVGTQTTAEGSFVGTQTTAEKSGWQAFLDFLAKQFRFSIIFLLLGSLIFLVCFPSMNKSFHDTHWNLLQQTVSGLEVMLGFGIKYYFDERMAEQEKEKAPNPKGE